VGRVPGTDPAHAGRVGPDTDLADAGAQWFTGRAGGGGDLLAAMLAMAALEGIP